MEALTRMPFLAQKKIFKRLAELADSRCLNKEDQERYDESKKVIDDWYSSFQGAYMSGEKKGKAAGLKEGLEEGKAEGLKEGLKEGKAEEKLASAKRLLAMGLSPEQVAQGADLPLEKVMELVN